MKNNINLTEGNITINLIKLSLPIMLSNFIQTFYNLTDTWWLGKLGSNAQAAVSVTGISFPLVFFISSFGFGFVVAGTALVAQYKGANKLDEIKLIIGQFLLILIGFILFFVTVNYFLLTPILQILKTPSDIFLLAQQYIGIIMNGMIFMFIFLTYQGIAHGMGDMITPMVIQIISVLLNVVLDPLFIFGIGVPRYETIGAGYATLISRIIAALLAIYFFIKKDKSIIPNLHHLKPNLNMLFKITKISIPASISQSVTSFGFLFLQGFVNSFGTLVITTNALGNRMTNFFMMPAMGVGNALTSIVGQNLGAGKTKRAKKSFYNAMFIVSTIMLLGSLTMYFYGVELTKFFINDRDVMRVGVRMFKLMSFSAFIFGGIFVFNGFFNGAGKTTAAMSFNIARLWLFRIPLVYILSGKLLEYIQPGLVFNIIEKISLPLKDYPYEALWWSMIYSNILSLIFAFILYKKINWKKNLLS